VALKKATFCFIVKIMKYFIHTFGCQMNKSDSERVASLFEKMGWKVAEKEKEADLILINMCSVRQSAVDRVYGLARKFLKFKKQNPKIKTLLTGCVPLVDFEKLKNFFDFILPIKTLPSWPEILEKEGFYLKSPPREKSFQQKLDYLSLKPKYEKIFSVYIPISFGCNYLCSFCIVPFVRGGLICRNPEEILEEARSAIENGAKEIWLLGQIVNNYFARDKKGELIDFAKLLEMINQIQGNFWVRFTSPHPKYFTDKLIETIAKSETITPYLNLPLQSGDDEILKLMRRNYTTKEYEELVRKIRKAFRVHRTGLEKEVAISTDIIVGFPGETENHFENTVKFFKKIKFDMAYIAQYSPRPGTDAEKMEIENPVPKKEKERRWKILNSILQEVALEKNKKFIGKEVEVLVEEFKDGFLIGKSRHYKTVKFEGEKNLIGNFVKVKILDALPWGLKGKIL
jgi:tRNA-2-methylthio-N6-dimethylallyladenosine synthase